MGSIRVFLDTDVLINWLCKEVDPNTGFKLWEAPYRIISLIEKRQIIAHTSLINIFEIRFVLRRKKRFEERKIKELIADLYKQLRIEVPDPIDIMTANKVQEEYLYDPFDAITYAVAVAISSECIITRDREFIDIVRTADFSAYTPEEFFERYFPKRTQSKEA
jgi:predicted nucleic acid-binding protein